MAMSEERRGEIALLYIRHLKRTEGVRLGPHFRREIGSLCQSIGIDIKEGMEFTELLISELMLEAFGKKMQLIGDGSLEGGH